jgi:penicillin-binding protein 1A
MFSVSCRGAAQCVTLRELRRGARLPEATRLYDSDGGLMAEVAGPLRHSLQANEIPKRVADAFVAVEDRRFWDHGGVDAMGVLRAAVRNLRAGGIEEGASTIPMQLVRTLWAESLRDMGPWRRKVIEARTAPRLVEDLGHQRVLDLYLNAIYLGNGVYGVERAAQLYFGVGVSGLTLGQLATLVGMARAPEYYDPLRYPERALGVRDVVLVALFDVGTIDQAQLEAALASDLEVSREDSTSEPRRGRTHLTAAVLRELRRVAPALAGAPGLEVHTTIDPLVQAAGEAALAAQIARIESGRYGPFEAADSLERLEGAAVALDPATGAVLGWVGGRDFARSEFDRVEQGTRQVGSLVKPFLVAAALEQGYGITDLVSADTVPIETGDGPWLPADHVQETVLPLREALIRSSNRAAAHLGMELGLERFARTAELEGLAESVPALPSATIGAFGASLLDMTAAYALFGNGGLRVEPHLITRIDDPDGSTLWARLDSSVPTRVLDPRSAFVVLDGMRAVVDRGTGYPVRASGYVGPAAGKTGTTNDGRDAWFIGLTPAVAAGVWIGFDQPREIVQGRGGGDLAAPSWAAWMRALERAPRSIRAAWVPPAGVERVYYDTATGEVVDLSCDAHLAMSFHEAWVVTGHYRRRPCEQPGWLRRLWRRVAPGEQEPLRPLRRRIR